LFLSSYVFAPFRTHCTAEASESLVKYLQIFISCKTAALRNQGRRFSFFATMGASNCVWVEGNLPKDKAKMIKYLDQVISFADEKELRRYRENLPHL